MLIERYDNTTLFSVEDIERFVTSVDADFVPRLSERVVLAEYTRKLIGKAELYVCHEDGAILGMAAIYCNDRAHDFAYLTFMGVSDAARGRGVGGALLQSCIDNVQSSGLRFFRTQTWSTNTRGLRLYMSHGFRITGLAADRAGDAVSVFIELDLRPEEAVKC